MKLKHIYTLLLFFIFIVAQAQQQIEIKYSGFLEFKEEDSPGLKIMTRDDSGQIHIVHEGVDMWCDQALLYSNENFVEAYGNVKMVQGDSINMTSKYVEYSGKTKLAFASGEVILKEPASTLTTDTLYFDRAKQQSFYKSGGKVVRDSSGTITSKIGRYYMNAKKYQFVKKVKLVNPDYTIDTEQLDFYTETGHAFLYGPSTIVTEDSKIYCEKGFYNTETKQGYAVKKSKIDYENRLFEGDSMYFDNNRSFASATNNIKVTDTINNSIVKGHYAEIYKLKDSVFITKRALAISLQENDSVYIHADTLMVTGKAENRITRAFKNAKFYKSDMSGKADSIHANHQTGLTELINLSNVNSKDAFVTKRQPVLWNLGNQMTGDTIQLKSNPKTEKLDSLIVFDNAFIISKDTLGAGFNQITGKILIGLFSEENTLKQVDINKNAESIYFARNDENELVGIDKSKSGSIMMLFANGEIEELRKIRQVDGKTYPESQFPKNVRKLRGFDWREEERPKSVEDLFSDDPPLNLPIIKGLEDYVPQEDFFDKEMLDRIEKADEAEAKKSKKTIASPKASRNVPNKKLKKGATLPLNVVKKIQPQLIESKEE
ncbi:OstA-like protein [Oceanihabitans sp. 2_MG-2023]|uniref:OstA-like protein n=1 Tax=Oceanihabitans sp. 2_MG-2023 TaxID=3062661 RepID=UPI0026E2729B|nr:OstA-like protein [Oceanihabitans sp. 2_MG-2023]MDO6598095.1 OstA-like protein [Oceanihabitans sp. 2_MG-2023]